MHKTIATLSLCLLAPSCVVAFGNQGDIGNVLEAHDARRELQAAVDELNVAYESGEVREAFLNSIEDSGDVIVIGSLAEEWTVGIESIRDAMAESEGESTYVGRRLHDSTLQISTRGDVGWLVERMDLIYDVDGEETALEGFRATSVWQRDDGKWRMVHFHGSMPDAVNEI